MVTGRWLLCGILASFCGFGCGSSGDDDPADKAPPLDPLVEAPLVRYVDPFTGTGGVGFGVGSAYPGPALPFSLIHPGPDTSTGNGGSPDFCHYSGYCYSDDEILGFSHTRMQGTGTPDYGNILVMPVVGFDAATVDNWGYRSKFSKDTERASPGFYEVTLDRYGIHVELTTGRRASIHRYTYPEGAGATVIFDPTHFIGGGGCVMEAGARVGSDGVVYGNVFYMGPMTRRDGGIRIYFAAEIDREQTATQAFSVSQRGKPLRNVLCPEPTGTASGIAVDLESGGTVHMKIGVSFISEDRARQNLVEEIPGWDFDGLRAEAERVWEDTLSVILVGGGTEDERTMFYSSLYRAFLMPTLFTEAGDQYIGFDWQVHRADGFQYYSDFSLWDTFRSLHPLVNLIAPDTARDFAVSLTKMIEEGGAVPRWPLGTSFGGAMIGSSADNTLAETYLKGITDFDAELAYQAMRRQAFEPKPDGARGAWRGGVEDYVRLGYVPHEVSVTLEYAYNDWALSGFAARLGHSEDAAIFKERGTNWKNLWDPETQFLRAKDASGAWVPGFNAECCPAGGGDSAYTEGNAWQWSWYVPHDGAGLVEAFGSTEAFVDKLTLLFEESRTLVWVEDGPHHLLPDNRYWHSNEPVIHAAYLFNDAGRHDLARKWAREVYRTQYRVGPDGLPGNDDGGTMSAWYIFSTLGFYPIAGGTEYWVGQPLFSHAVIRRAAGDIVIEARGAGDPEKDFPTLSVDGTNVVGRFDHGELADGARLVFR